MKKTFGMIFSSKEDEVLKATCKDNRHTWRNALTIGNEYEVLNKYIDSYGVKILEIKCDDGEIRPYRAERFEFKKYTVRRYNKMNRGVRKNGI